jgi:hypothetical protein
MSDYHILPSDRIISYIASGTVTSYSFPFIVWEKDGIAVYLDDDVVDTRDYEVNNLGDFSGGTVVFHDPPQAGKRVTIVGDTPPPARGGLFSIHRPHIPCHEPRP